MDMSIGSGHKPSVLEELSALTDGELDSASAAHVCAAWREDGRVRATWHAYQLLGDVLRSDDLASRPDHDAAFLTALRARLADEPVVLAPQPTAVAVDVPQEQLVAAGSRRATKWAWLAPSAVAAGFVLVAGALLVMRGPTTGSSAARGPVVAAASAVGAVPATAVRLVPRQVSSSGRVIRDPQLDRYLAAHQHFAGTSALGVSSGLVRNAVAEDPPR
jgi:sigma-E factor negative regulatory protein RseA